MKYLFYLFIFLFLFKPAVFWGQIKKANQLYEAAEYSQAIPIYKKLLHKSDSVEALQKLANCYRILKNYMQAEVYYQKVVDYPGTLPITQFYYGLVLKNNGKVEEAKKQFVKYAALVPGDKSIVIATQSCDDIIVWSNYASEFEIANVKEINSTKAEFCPVVYQNKLLFVTERTQNLVEPEHASFNDQPFLDIYSINMEKDANGKLHFSKPRPFSAAINTQYHDGPVSFTDDFNTLFVTQVSGTNEGKNHVNRPKIYIYRNAKQKGTKWKLLEEFPYNSNIYSVQHPAITPDGLTLYFASDMPGGFGGFDLYHSKKVDGKWQQPVNLGENINTVGNEVFPSVRKDLVLYFSSDGHSGYGGLDIFSSEKIDGIWNKPVHYKKPLNSSTDDFGVLFVSEDFKTGYFSSDRSNGSGSDDIYSFLNIYKEITIEGKVLLSKNISMPAKNTKLSLFNQYGTLVGTTTSDSTGFFQFQKLSPNFQYFVAVDENEPAYQSHHQLYRTDSKLEIIPVTIYSDKGGTFKFTNLPADINRLSTLEETDTDFALYGTLAFGDSASNTLPFAKIYLLDENGDTLKVITTNAAGKFAFTKLLPGGNYFINVDEKDARLQGIHKLTIRNQKGDKISEINLLDKSYRFTLLPSDQTKLHFTPEEDADFKFNMDGKLLAADGTNNALPNVKLELVNANNQVVQTTTTNNYGLFKFKKVSPDQNYFVRISEEAALKLNMTKVLLADAGGNVSELSMDKNKQFVYKVLSGDKSSLSFMSVDDPNMSINYRGGIIKDDRLDTPMPDLKISLVDQKGNLIQRAVTNRNGYFIFKDLTSLTDHSILVDGKENNLEGITALYLIDESGRKIKKMIINSSGVFVFQMLASESVAMGMLQVDDTQLSDSLFNDIAMMNYAKQKADKLSDNNAKQNVDYNSPLSYSYSGGILKGDGSGTPIPDLKIILVDQKGSVIQKTVTDKSGRFVFQDLASVSDYSILVNARENNLTGISTLYLVDDSGKKIKKMMINSSGTFVFQMLASESVALGMVEEEDTQLLDSLIGEIKSIDNATQNMGGIKVNLINDAGMVAASGYTDERGQFVFKGLPVDKNYFVEIDDSDSSKNSNLIMQIINGKGDVLKKMAMDDDFNYQYLASDNVVMKMAQVYDDESILSLTIKGKLLNAGNSPIVNSTVKLLDEKRNVMQTAQTDNDGKFIFSKLSTSDSYAIILDENDPQLKSTSRCVIANEKGAIIHEFRNNASKSYRYKLLPSDLLLLKTAQEEDNIELATFNDDKVSNSVTSPNASVDNKASNNLPLSSTLVDSTILSPIYFAFNEYAVSQNSTSQLNDLVNFLRKHPNVILEINGHTDSKGPNTYNINLGYKRAASVSKYLVRKGISGKRMRIKTSGKKFPAKPNENTDGIDNPKNRAANRRVEFRKVGFN